jgi:hypothetical protein
MLPLPIPYPTSSPFILISRLLHILPSCIPTCDRYRWEIEVIDAGPEPSVRSTAARLLMQATWGPSVSDIDALANGLAGDAEAWVTEQMALPATLHRSYFRARANPRYPQGTGGRVTATLPIGGLRLACDAGSRWSRFALFKDDVGRSITTTPGSVAGTTALIINGEQRTVVSDTALSAVGTTGPFVICDVNDESVGGDVTITTSALCGGAAPTYVIANPAITSPPSSRVVVLSTNPNRVTDLTPPIQDAVILVAGEIILPHSLPFFSLRVCHSYPPPPPTHTHTRSRALAHSVRAHLSLCLSVDVYLLICLPLSLFFLCRTHTDVHVQHNNT